jgi:hypothetical protein
VRKAARFTSMRRPCVHTTSALHNCCVHTRVQQVPRTSSMSSSSMLMALLRVQLVHRQVAGGGHASGGAGSADFACTRCGRAVTAGLDSCL